MDNVGEDSQHLFIGDFIKNYMQGEDIKIDLKMEFKLTTSIPEILSILINKYCI